MTEREAAEILRRIAERQTLGTFDKQAILATIAPHDFEVVVRAVVAVLQREPFVGAHNLGAELRGRAGEPVNTSSALPLISAETRWALGGEHTTTERAPKDQLLDGARRAREALNRHLRAVPDEEAS